MNLYIGDKNFSSWSFRAWLALKSAGIDFNETIIPLRRPDSKEKILKISPSGYVPCLKNGSLRIHDSLAISEYAHELNSKSQLLPNNIEMKAIIRSLCSEMHSGFIHLRQEFPMDMKYRGTQHPTDNAKLEIARILTIWKTIKGTYGYSGKFLFGHWTLADVFFAPVVSRFISYNLDARDCQQYIDDVSETPLYQEWYQHA